MRTLSYLFCLAFFLPFLSRGQTLKMIELDSGAGSSSPKYLTEFNNQVYFSALKTTDPGQGITADNELWKTDGTQSGSVKVKDLGTSVDGSSNPKYLKVSGSNLFFSANGNAYRTDGSESGTILLLPSMIVNSEFIPAGTDVLFLAGAAEGGLSQPYASGGTAANTRLIKDVNAYSMGKAGNTVYLAVNDATQGNQLWKTDGTSSGTVLVKDLFAGDPSVLNESATNANIVSFTDANGTLFFVVKQANRYDLWKSDGSSAGTSLIVSFTNCSDLSALGGYGNQFLFFASTDSSGLFSSDGTAAGTVLLKADLLSFNNNNDPGYNKTFLLNNVLYFKAGDLFTGQELWKTDGTANGTNLVADLNQGSLHGVSSLLASDGKVIYLSGTDGSTGYEVWQTDGVSGIQLVADLNPGATGSNPQYGLYTSQGLYVSAADYFHGRELWNISDMSTSNEPPILSLTTRNNTTTFTAPASVTFKANAMDSDGSIVKVAFYNYDNIYTLLGVDSTAPYSFVWNNVPQGQYVVRAAAYDDRGAFQVADMIITVGSGNALPSIIITAPADSAAVSANDTITVSANAIDSDGTIAKVTFAYFHDGTSTVIDVTTPPYTASFPAGSTKGYNSVLVTATDNQGGASSASVVVNVTSNNIPPSISFTSPVNNATVAAPASVTLTADATDGDGTIKKVEFTYTQAGLSTPVVIFDSVAPYSATVNLTPGVYNIKGIATDNSGDTTSATVKLTVTGNASPVLAITAPMNNATVHGPTSVVVYATASDTDGTIKKVAFTYLCPSLGTTGSSVDSVAPYSFTLNVPLGPADYMIMAEATDDGGATASASIGLHVAGNTPPVVAFTAPGNNDTIPSLESVFLMADASDADGTVKKVVFSYIKAGSTTPVTVVDSVAPYTTVFTVGKGPEDYVITAIATDNLGDTSSATIALHVAGNTSPAVSITSPADNSTIAAQSPLTVEATASDADGFVDRVIFTYVKTGGTPVSIVDSVAPYSFTFTPGSGSADYKIYATAKDDLGDTTTASITVHTAQGNVAPVVTITAPSNNSTVVSLANVSIQATATDADGTVKAVTFSIFKSGTTVPVIFIDSVAPYTTSFNVGTGPADYTIYATAIDNTGDSSTASAALHVIANLPPAIAITAPADKSAVTPYTTVTVKATAADFDGTVKAVIFSYMKDGSSFPITTVDSVAPYTMSFNVGNGPADYTILATAKDNVGDSSTASIALHVAANLHPTIAITSPADSTTVPNLSDVTVKATAADADGTIQEVVFTYYKAGSSDFKVIEDTSAPYSATFNVGSGPADYTIYATAIDNLGDTSNAFITLHVAANIHPVVTITAPANNVTVPNLSDVTVQATATDADGSIKEVVFTYVKDGTTDYKFIEDTTAPYSATFNVGNGPAGYTIYATAIDNLGDTSNASVVLHVAANLHPVIAIVSPVNNDTVKSLSKINVLSTASDPDGTIKKVVFSYYTTYNNVITVVEDSVAPYTVDFSVLHGPKDYFITATAIDNLGDSATASVKLHVLENMSPHITFTSPAPYDTMPAYTDVNVAVSATDADGTIKKVTFKYIKEGDAIPTTVVDSIAPYALIINSGKGPATFDVLATATDDIGDETSTLTIYYVAPNVAPVIRITSPASKDTVPSASVVTINATALDTDGVIKQVKFTYLQTGTTTVKTIVDSVAPYSASFTVGKGPLDYTVWATATDNGGDSATTSVSIHVLPNVPPKIVITSPANNTTVTSNTNITIEATATDTDGTIKNVTFTILEAGVATPTIIVDSVAPYTAPLGAITEPGDYMILATATDNAGGTASASIVIHVLNQVPVVKITAPKDSIIVAPNSAVVIQATATDPDGTVTKVVFTYMQDDNEVDLVDKTAPYSGVITVGSTPGFYTVIASATDNAGGVGSDTIVIRVQAVNLPPTIVITSPANNTTVTGPAVVTVTATATDTDGTVKKVTFSYTPAGSTTPVTIVDSVAPYSADINVGKGPADYVVTATATDDQGATATATVTIHVATNKLPTIVITSPANNSNVPNTGIVVVTAVPSDSDGTVKKVVFSYTPAGSTNPVTVTDSVAPYTDTLNLGTKPGDYTITATATDDKGGTASTSIVVHILNLPPVITITAPANNATIYSPAPVNVTATATDPDGTIKMVTFTFTQAGTTNVLTQVDSVAPYAVSFPSGVTTADYTIVAVATDNNGATATSATITVHIIAPDISGSTCMGVNGTFVYELNPVHRVNATGYNWWFNGYTQTITPAPGAPYRVTVAAGQWQRGGQICVGVTYKGAPYYAQYCMTITLCQSARLGEEAEAVASAISISPNPAVDYFNFTTQRAIRSIMVTNTLGVVVLTRSEIAESTTVKFGEELNSGIYNVHIQYAEGDEETVRVIKTE